jgi:hypothetical protein
LTAVEDAGSASRVAAVDSGTVIGTVSRIAACCTPAVAFAAAGAFARGASERIDWIASVAGLVTLGDDSDFRVLACDASQDPGVVVKSLATGSVVRERERVPVKPLEEALVVEVETAALVEPDDEVERREREIGTVGVS